MDTGKRNGDIQTKKGRPSHKYKMMGTATRGRKGGDVSTETEYVPPKKANAGNVIKCNVGKGHMGSNLAHDNEAPFPESLVEPFREMLLPSRWDRLRSVLWIRNDWRRSSETRASVCRL